MTLAVSLDLGLVVGAVGLLLTGIALYLSHLRRGRVTLRQVPTHLEWARGGGINEVPDLYRVTVRLAANNPGANPCVLERIVVDHVDVDGPAELISGAANGQITGVAGTEVLSAVIDPSPSKQFEFKFELQGLVSSAIHTTPTPDLVPFATAIGQLEGLAVVIRGDYQQTTRRGTKSKTTTVKVLLPVEQARATAAEFWRGQGRDDLAELAEPPR